MPIYEFSCKECGNKFEALRLSSSGFNDVECPKCKSKKVAKEMSTFAPSMGSDSSSGPTAACGMPSGTCGSGMCGMH